MPAYGLAQVACELSTLTFARVTNVRVQKTGGDVVSHYYGFAEDIGDTRDPRTVWFKKMTHVCAAGRPGLFVGPVHLSATGLPRKNDIVVGRVTESAKGPMFEWWCHDAGPLWAFTRAVVSGHVRRDSREDMGPDLWALARLVVSGDITAAKNAAFAWHAAELARCPALYRAYVERGAARGGHAGRSCDDDQGGDVAAATLTVDHLRHVLQNT